MKTATKERPILFSGPMVRAILEGRKTQTRRVIKPQPEDHKGMAVSRAPKPCPYGQPGGQLWVRETWQHEDGSCDDHGCGQPSHIYHKATEVYPESLTWRPSIYMPRWASRILLEVTHVRVERLQEITEEDAQAEGVGRGSFEEDCSPQDEQLNAECGYFPPRSYAGGFSYLWDTINAKRGFPWDSNPWVWVIEFRYATSDEDKNAKRIAGDVRRSQRAAWIMKDADGRHLSCENAEKAKAPKCPWCKR